MTKLLSRRCFASISAAALLLPSACTVPAAESPDEPARLTGATSFSLGGDRERSPWRITLYVPPGPVPEAGWPVLYLLDGNAVIGTAIDIERVQAPYPDGSGISSRFAIVGIGYPTNEAYDGTRRSWDYTPPPGRSYPPYRPDGPALRTGGADAFLRFIIDDLKPAIAQRCRIDQSRQALFGHSFGGLFVLYALSNAPASFSHWIAASPSIYWEDLTILSSISTLENRPAAGARVLLLAGAYEEHLAPFQRDAPDRETRLSRLRIYRTVELTCWMAERLGNIPGLHSTFHLIPGRTHMNVLPEALNTAVEFSMGRTDAPVMPVSCAAKP